jgi:hypothetical protein
LTPKPKPLQGVPGIEVTDGGAACEDVAAKPSASAASARLVHVFIFM